MPGGRPTKYCQDILDKTQDYLDNFKKYGDEFPSDVGLSLVLNITAETVLQWKNQEEKPEFSWMLKQIKARQHQQLMNNGVNGTFNSTITKLVLSKHGYSERLETVIEGNSEKPLESKWTVEIIDNTSRD